jgi:hypothetical protein
MASARYATAVILTLSALISSYSYGYPDANCAAGCWNNYAKEYGSCPSLNRDAEAYFWCSEKAQNSQERCFSACPTVSIDAGTNSGVNTDMSPAKRGRTQ